MSPVHVQFPKMMICMLQIINLDNVQVCYTHPGEGRRGRDGMVVGSTTICDKVCQLLFLLVTLCHVILFYFPRYDH
jgi:hypothetical protein